ncbi:MAG: hypothetical protein WAV98_04000, partial [Minisyncoccia bacterium]
MPFTCIITGSPCITCDGKNDNVAVCAYNTVVDFELRNSISVIASRYSDVAIYVFVLDCHALRARKDRIISSFV